MSLRCVWGLLRPDVPASRPPSEEWADIRHLVRCCAKPQGSRRVVPTFLQAVSATLVNQQIPSANQRNRRIRISPH